jgi:hypothetical protein
LQPQANKRINPRMQDLAFADKSQLARNKQPQPRITPRVKAAIDAMVERGLDYAQAAAETGLTARNMRLALERPHVLAYYRAQCHVLRSARHARNIHRLAEIADAENNMPAVNAIKALEQLADEQSAKSTHASPGVTIRIVNVNATPAQQTQTTIDANIDSAELTDER